MSASLIALDVMGGDHAPRAILEGALAAVAPEKGPALPAERILLVGDEECIRTGLDELGGADLGLAILHAPEAIGMHEKPGQALRAKPRSIAVGVGAVKQGAAGAFVSMGNTGAVVGASTIGLGTLEGVRRPGIAVTVGVTGRPVTMMDMGANIVPKPDHLVQYGLMGQTFQRKCLGVEKPRIGLLNIGEEPSKGTDLVKEAHGLLQESGLDFVGNIEGGDLFGEAADVVVTDGFTGNVALKLMEGMAGFMLGMLMGELQAQSASWAPESLGKVRRKIDYSEYGGALLLGVNGVVVIGHGRSDARAVSNALSLAARTLDSSVNQDIVAGLAERKAAQASLGGSESQG